MPIVLVIDFLSVYLHHSILSPSEIINTLSLPLPHSGNTISLIYMGNSERHRCIGVPNVETNILKRLIPIETITAVIFSVNKPFYSIIALRAVFLLLLATFNHIPPFTFQHKAECFALLCHFLILLFSYFFYKLTNYK